MDQISDEPINIERRLIIMRCVWTNGLQTNSIVHKYISPYWDHKKSEFIDKKIRRSIINIWILIFKTKLQKNQLIGAVNSESIKVDAAQKTLLSIVKLFT